MKPYALSALMILVAACGVNVDVLSTLDGGTIGNATGGAASTTGEQVNGGSDPTGGIASTGGSVATGSATVNEGTLITLERTICQGTCPSYTLSISGTGTVAYQGRQYVRVTGAVSTQIPVSDVQSLVDMMLQADYFHLTMPTECLLRTTDMPKVNTSLTLDGQKHAVEDYLGNECAPAVIRTIEDRIDTVARSAQWVKCDSGSCPIDGAASRTECGCQYQATPCPSNVPLCGVTCDESSTTAACLECPIPTSCDGTACNTLGQHCTYLPGGQQCECVADSAGTKKWKYPRDLE